MKSELLDDQHLKAHLAAIVESADDAIISKDLNAIITSWNKGAERMYGYTAEEVIGKPISILVPANITNDVSVILEQIKQGHRVEHYETKRMAKNGEILDVSLTVSPIYDNNGCIVGASKIARNITERKQAERQIASLHDQVRETAERITRLQAVTAALSSALTVSDVADVFVKQGVDIIGASAASITLLVDDKTLRVIGAVGYSDAALQLWRKLSIDTPIAVVEVIRTGSPIWIESQNAWDERYPSIAPINPQYQSWVVLPLTIEGHTLGAISFDFALPRTFSKADQALVLALAEQCTQALDRAQVYERERQARQEAEQANKLKTEFLAMISHELRTPLTSIKGFASTLLSSDITWDADNQREFINIISTEADKLTELIDQLLDLSRSQARTLRIYRQPTTVENILRIARPQIEILTVRHHLTIQDHQNLPLVMVDAQRIAQVLVNLINNSVKYSPPGTAIEVLFSVQGAAVQVDVSDEGPGIPIADREKVFEAFWQRGDTNDSTKMKGAGLGLAICKALIEAHGGRIWIADRHSPGTTISFTLAVVN